MPFTRAIAFIDGNNLYHNLKHLFPKPSIIDLRLLTELICKKFNLQLIDIFYYNSIPDIRDGAPLYYKHLRYLSQLEKQGIHVRRRKLQVMHLTELKEERKRFIDSLELCPHCKPLVEVCFLDTLGTIQKKEKGIDIKIAVDMIRNSIMEESCDCCILISGDADFLPAMHVIKEAGKEVVSSMVAYGYSRGLRNGSFKYLILTKEDLVQCMKPLVKNDTFL